MKTILFNPFALTLALVLFCVQHNAAQTLGKPVPAPNPNISSPNPWEIACATEDFNEFFVNFTWNPPLVGTDNIFILELSDANGSFGSPTELDRAADKNQDFDFEFSFSLAENIQGNNYRFRVRSTDPELTSPESDAFEMYYIGFDRNIQISQDGNGNIPPMGTLNVCDGSGVVLVADNVPDPDNYNYIWYRSGTILPETSNSLTVTESGMYFTEINYGPNCTNSGNTISNEITVNLNTPQGLAINTPSQTTLCSNETVTLTANINGSGHLYTWFNGSSIVAGPTVDLDSYTVDGSVSGFEGDYSVQIEGASICTEQSEAIAITGAGDHTVSLDHGTDIVLLPGQSQELSVSTTAVSPSYQWFQDNTVIAGANSSTLSINEAGIYRVEVTENGGACTVPPKSSENITVVLPESFELAIDYTDAYTECMQGPLQLSIASITAVNTDGSRLVVTDDIKDNFTYQWFNEGNALAGRTADQIQLNDASENGNYTLTGELDAFTMTSNALNVRLNPNDAITINSTSFVVCDGITPQLSTTADLTGLNYEWLRNGTSISSTDEVIDITQSGIYSLRITTDGCPVLSNDLTILDLDNSIVQLDTDDNIVFPEGESQTVNASGADSYQWFDQGNSLLSSTSSVTLSEEGEYLLLAQIEECQVSRTLTVSFRDNFDIPNVITANGDGINDLWVLPNTYSRNNEVSVVIYNEQGQEVVNQTGYQNNWPPSSTAFTKKNQIFYYKIRNARNTLRQGTITVIR